MVKISRKVDKKFLIQNINAKKIALIKIYAPSIEFYNKVLVFLLFYNILAFTIVFLSKKIIY